MPSFKEWKYAFYKNEQAFTLIEALFALSIFMFIVFFVAPIFQIVLNEKAAQGESQSMEWEVFCSQMKKEIRMVTQVDVVAGKLILTKDSDTIQYEKYGNNLRRRVNFTGHEIVLQNVSEVVFVILHN